MSILTARRKLLTAGLALPAGIALARSAKAAAIKGGGYPPPGLSMITNREFMIDQLNEGAVFADDASSIDTWPSAFPPENCYNGQRVSTSPPPGFSCFQRITMTGNVPASAPVILNQDILSRPDLVWGTSSAVPLWAVGLIRSSIDCSISFSMTDYYVTGTIFAHRIDLTGGVWNNVVFPVPGLASYDPSPTGGLVINFALSPVNSFLVPTADVWTNIGAWNVGYLAGQTDLTAHPGMTIDFAGFDLRPASAPYPFEHLGFDFYLRECQRFYRKSFSIGDVRASVSGVYQVGVAPAQGASPSGGGLQFISSGGPLVLVWDFDEEMLYAPTVTTFNPVSANASFRDLTANADYAVTLVEFGTRRIVLANTADTVAAGHRIGLDITAFSGF